MTNWYDKKECDLHYFKLEFINLDIYIGGRPDHGGTTKSFAKSIDTWISLTDRLSDEYTVPPWGPQMYWYPLIESRRIADWGWKVFFWFVKLMDRELSHNEKRRLYIHCDGGTHRSPTMVYMWMKLHTTRMAALKIFSDRVIVPDNAYHRRNFPKPEDYLTSHEKDGTIYPEDLRKRLHQKMKDKPEYHLESLLNELKWEDEKHEEI